MISSRPLSLRELNRTLLARQMLLERKRMPAAGAVSKLLALQAQYAPSPYVALWSRLAGFRKEQLYDERLVKAGSFRTTLHVMARSDYPAIAAAYMESQRARVKTDPALLLAALPDTPMTRAQYFEIASRVLGTDDRWVIEFAGRMIPGVRTEPLGAWPHNKPSPWIVWRDVLPDAGESATRIVRAYLAAYGPATRKDIVKFTGFRMRQVDPALEGMRERDGYWDAPRVPPIAADVAAPVRFLPAFDSIILAHADRTRIVPAEYEEVVFNKKNATVKNTFTVDGFVAGAWRIEGSRIAIEAFAPLPLKWRREVDAEGERLLAWYLS
jgi:hypothetical protein